MDNAKYILHVLSACIVSGVVVVFHKYILISERDVRRSTHTPLSLLHSSIFTPISNLVLVFYI